MVGEDNTVIAAGLGISETSVRNILKEFKEGRFSEYNQLVPNADASHRLMRELRVKGISVANAIVGAIVFTRLLELGIDPTQLQAIMTRLHDLIGNTPPAEFGRAVQQLVMLQEERGLTFGDLELLIISRKAELEEILGKVKAANAESAVAEAKKNESQVDMDRTLKENDTTKKLIGVFAAFRRSLKVAGLSSDNMEIDMKTVSQFTNAARRQGFLEAARELQRLETETGMDFKTLVQNYKENREFNEKNRRERDEFVKSKERVDRYLAIVDRLQKAGIDIEQD
jgi:DNA-binding Lrp family transcriptional regulator